MNRGASMQPEMAALEIVRIIEIRDTRDFIEEGDRWVALPGTGDVHQCSRCGRDHEVWVTVECADGTEAVVGRSCAKSDSLEISERIRKGVASATRTARNTAQLRKAEADLAAYDTAVVEVEAARLPAIVESAEEKPGYAGRTYSRIAFTCGDSTAYAFSTDESINREERIRCAVEGYRRRRMFERGFNFYPARWTYTERITQLRKRLNLPT